MTRWLVLSLSRRMDNKTGGFDAKADYFEHNRWLNSDYDGGGLCAISPSDGDADCRSAGDGRGHSW